MQTAASAELQPLRTIVQGDIRIFGLPPKLIEKLRIAFTFRNPKYDMALRLGHRADGIPEDVSGMLEDSDGSVRLLRGSVAKAKKILARDGYCMAFQDYRTLGVPLKTKRSILEKLRPYQLDAVRALQSDIQGTVIIATGGGKTYAGLGCLQAAGRSTLIGVHTTDLLDQWRADIVDELGIEPGVVANGKFTWSEEITVAMVQTLANCAHDEPWLSRFGMFMLDECHHAPASTFLSLICSMPAKFRVGLTATIDRDDQMTPFIEWSFGRRLVEVSANKLIDMGFLLRPTVIPIITTFTFEFKGHQSRRVPALQKAICKDVDRNILIATTAVRDAKDGESVVILTNDKDHCDVLAEYCKTLGFPAKVITSKVKKKFRRGALADLATGEQRLIIATSLFNEGINIVRLSRIVLALPQRGKVGTTQKLGRIMRPYKDKKPKIYDLVDVEVKELMGRWSERRQAYKAIGMDVPSVT